MGRPSGLRPASTGAAVAQAPSPDTGRSFPRSSTRLDPSPNPNSFACSRIVAATSIVAELDEAAALRERLTAFRDARVGLV
jgi:hypothetical protein